MAKQVTVQIKALPGERVWVQNYRRKNRKREVPWEDGEVTMATTIWDEDGNYRIQYRVLLDRQSRSGNVVTVTVGDDQISSQPF